MRDSCPWRLSTGYSIPRMFAIIMVAGVLASASTTRSNAQAPALAYTPDSIFMALFANGDALVEYDVLMSNATTATANSTIPIKLFGTNISELIVTDLDDKIVPFKTIEPGEIGVTPGKATGVRISYLTPDLVNKVGRTWTFNLQSSVDVAIKMPADSVPIDYGSNVPTLSPIGSQTLLTFKAGGIHFSYIIGSLDTEDQAGLAIKFADAAIKQAKVDYQGIALPDQEDLLAKAIAAKNSGKFGDAVKLATQASDQVQVAISEFTSAKSDISNATKQIAQASGQGHDTARATSLLNQANTEFSQGKYSQAKATVAQAISALNDTAQLGSRASIPVIAIIGIAVAGGGAGAYYFLFRKKTMVTRSAEILHDSDPPNSSMQPVLEPQQLQNQEENQERRENNSISNLPPVESARALAGIPESQTDTSLLARIVAKIIEDKPHLRPEDRDVLGFLAEKEGAAFESEVRSRFSLPKTTVWRLVKRLEREELVEIRKAGGQNLIKLRFEGRQAK
jgi:uncharacterized membrane protein